MHGPSFTRDVTMHIFWQLQELQRQSRELGVMFKEACVLDETVGRIESWRQNAEKAIAQTPDLKQLQQLISTGESLPVEFPNLLHALQDKMKQAEMWVERVRNIVPRPNRTRRSADNEKVCHCFCIISEARSYSRAALD